MPFNNRNIEHLEKAFVHPTDYEIQTQSNIFERKNGSENTSTIFENALASSDEDWADPCQEFAHSVLFFMIVAVASVGWITFGYTSFKT